jgi:hypothetical protein
MQLKFKVNYNFPDYTVIFIMFKHSAFVIKFICYMWQLRFRPCLTWKYYFVEPHE